jgi:hypothetical protein
VTTAYVKHDGYRWAVVSHYLDDGEEWYALRRHIPGRKPVELVARVRECEQTTLTKQKRRIRDDKVVMEIDAAGNVALRKRGGRKKFLTTLTGLYAMAARHEAAIKMRDRAYARRTRRRG